MDAVVRAPPLRPLAAGAPRGVVNGPRAACTPVTAALLSSGRATPRGVGADAAALGMLGFCCAALLRENRLRGGRRTQLRPSPGSSLQSMGRVTRLPSLGATSLQRDFVPSSAPSSSSRDDGLPLFCDRVPFSRAFHCRACKKYLPSEVALQEHIRSAGHLDHVRGQQRVAAALDAHLGLRSPDLKKPASSHRTLQGEVPPPFCERVDNPIGMGVCTYRCVLCEVQCKTFEQLLIHVKSKKHVKRLSPRGQDGEEGTGRGDAATAAQEQLRGITAFLRRAKAARQRRDASRAVAALRSASQLTGGGDDAPALQEIRSELPRVLRVAAADGSAEDYCASLGLFPELGATLQASTFALVLEHLMVRMHMPQVPALIRLTLNLAIPKSDDATVVPPLATGAEEGEPRRASRDPASGRAPALQGAPRPESLLGRVQLSDTAAAAYFAHFSTLLNLEFLEELTQAWTRSHSLESQGHTLQGLRAVDSAATAEQLSFEVPLEEDMSRCDLQVGDAVWVSQGGPAWLAEVTRLPAPAAVDRDAQDGGSDLDRGSSGRLLCVRPYFGLPSSVLERKSCEDWHVARAACLATYRQRMQALVDLATSTPGRRPAVWDVLLSGVFPRVRTSAPDGARLRLERLAAEDVAPRDGLEALLLLREQVRSGTEEEGLASLGPSQREAIAAALGRRLTVIQASPDSGRTHVAAQILQVWVRRLGVRPVLTLCSSDATADVLTRMAASHGLNVVRIGQPAEAAGPDVKAAFLDARMSEKRRSREAHGGDAVSSIVTDVTKSQIRRERRLQDQRDRIAVLKGADVVCITAATASSPSARSVLNTLDFNAVVFEEASCVTELCTVAPLVFSGAQRAVIIAEDGLVPSGIVSIEARRLGLGLPIHERLVKQGVVPCVLDA